MKKKPPASDAFAGDPAVNAVAGAMSAGAVLTALFPVDATKTVMQVHGGSALSALSGLLAADAPLRRMYRGLGPALAEQMLNRSMLFGIGATIKRHLVPAEWPEVARDMGSGALAALTKTAVLHPLDTVKCRWQTGLPLHRLDGLYAGAPRRARNCPHVWL